MFEKKPFAKFRNIKNLDVTAAATQQMKEEIGDQILTEEHAKMLREKYGIAPPQFSGSEPSVIAQEKRKAA